MNSKTVGMMNRFLLAIGLSCLSASLWAQDPMFSQFYAAPLSLNPALTGISDAPMIHLNYRNQWSGIPNAYSTYSASYHQYVPKANSGFGVSALGDVAGNGIYSTFQATVHYAYDIRFSKQSFLRMGVEGGLVNKRLAWDKLVFLDQINPLTGYTDANGNPIPTEEGQPGLNVNYFDMGLGTLVHLPYFYAGFAVHHLTAPKEGFLRANNYLGEVPLRLTFHAGGEIPLQRRNKIKQYAFLSPNVLFVKQRQFHQLHIGAYCRYNVFLSGLSFRHTFGNSDAVIVMLGFQKNFIKIAYSYDFTVSRLGMKSGGSHEVSLTFHFQNERLRRQQRYGDCMQLFY